VELKREKLEKNIPRHNTHVRKNFFAA